jgi:hypothetical protein
VANPAEFGLVEVPIHHTVTLAKPIKRELRGGIGFSDVILRIIRTYDAELSESALAEKQIKARVQSIPAKGRFIKKGDSERRITKLIYRSGLPSPTLTAPFIQFLKSERIIPTL